MRLHIPRQTFTLNKRMGSRVIALHLWALPLEVKWPGHAAEDPAITTAVRAEVRGRWILESVSVGAMLAGVRPRMTLSEAKARLPSLIVKNRDLEAETQALSRAAEFLLSFGPVVEVCAPNMLFVEVGHSEKALIHQLGLKDADSETFERAVVALLEKTLAHAGHVASVVLGETPDATRTLAQHLSWTALPRSPVAKRLKGRGRARAVNPTPAPKRRRRLKKAVRTLVIPPGGEARAQATLPLSALAWTDLRQDPKHLHYEHIRDALASLRTLGITEVGRLASMPSDQIASRFADAGHTLMQRALGLADRPLKPFRPPDQLVERAEFDHITEDLEPVFFVLQGVLSRLAERLDARALAVNTVELSFIVEPGLGHVVNYEAHRAKNSKRVEKIQLRFARPTRKARLMLTLAKDRLGGALPGAVRGLSATAISPHVDHGAQLDLFTAHEKRLEAVGELVTRLQVTLGPQAVFSPQVKDTHRPEAAWRAQAFDIDSALRCEKETRPVKVEMAAVAPPSDTTRGQTYPLPQVQPNLNVTGVCKNGEALEAAALGLSTQADAVTSRPWPKPVPRKPTDEPLAPVPPRPLIILPEPEPATMLSTSGMDEGVLVWRGERHQLIHLQGRENLETEWWMPSPVRRNYMVAEATDGRRFWLYRAPEGQTFVHGIFD